MHFKKAVPKNEFVLNHLFKSLNNLIKVTKNSKEFKYEVYSENGK